MHGGLTLLIALAPAAARAVEEAIPLLEEGVLEDSDFGVKIFRKVKSMLVPKSEMVGPKRFELLIF
jgi:hypothetical protein